MKIDSIVSPRFIQVDDFGNAALHCSIETAAGIERVLMTCYGLVIVGGSGDYVRFYGYVGNRTNTHMREFSVVNSRTDLLKQLDKKIAKFIEQFDVANTATEYSQAAVDHAEANLRRASELRRLIERN